MTAPTQALLGALLEWDRRRIAQSMRRHRQNDYTEYLARQARAAAALNAPPSEWSSEMRDHYQQLLEVAGGAATAVFRALVINEPPLRLSGPFPVKVTKLELLAAAAEVGVLDRLRRSASQQVWRA